jgi:glycosyltransferase involved in cell wall biosynthesis
LFEEYPDAPLVAISEDQRRPVPDANWRGTVHHGLPRDLYTFRPRPGKYLAFLGRVAPEKGLDRAIAIARATGMKLKIAAKVDPVDRVYYQENIAPLLEEAGDVVEFPGELGGKDKDDFLGGAYALLFPINWDEPFGLVMIEALACGTPVIAFPHGSVPEVLRDGVTGFLVESVEEAVRAVPRIAMLERRRCRQEFEERFDAARMARDYVEVYHRVINATREHPTLRAPRPAAPLHRERLAPALATSAAG